MSGAALETLTAGLEERAERLARERGHTRRGVFAICGDSFELAFAPEAELDGEFRATCLETGEPLAAHGWMFEAIELEEVGHGA